MGTHGHVVFVLIGAGKPLTGCRRGPNCDFVFACEHIAVGRHGFFIKSDQFIFRIVAPVLHRLDVQLPLAKAHMNVGGAGIVAMFAAFNSAGIDREADIDPSIVGTNIQAANRRMHMHVLCPAILAVLHGTAGSREAKSTQHQSGCGQLSCGATISGEASLFWTAVGPKIPEVLDAHDTPPRPDAAGHPCDQDTLQAWGQVQPG